MESEESFLDGDDDDLALASMRLRAARAELDRRCTAAGLPFHHFSMALDGSEEDDDLATQVTLRAGRDTRDVYCTDYTDYLRLLSFEFEKFKFIAGFDAIVNYETGEVEAIVRHATGNIGTNPRMLLARVLGVPMRDLPSEAITLRSPDASTLVSLAGISEQLRALTNFSSGNVLSLRITKPGTSTHEAAKELLIRIADALFFQIDTTQELPLLLARSKRTSSRPTSRKGGTPLFPVQGYDAAPASLYWYARSAAGMPLLQYLAYYQVIEFYYPTYSQAEARRRVRNILKDPSFRGDREADIAKVLSVVQTSRSGALGDERSQLKATLAECLDDEDLRDFLREDELRSDFLSKDRTLTERRLSISSDVSDLRNELAERIYDIRCKIVHTKTDAKTGSLELLLPFSRDAEKLDFDIEVIRYVARKVLIAASAPI